MRLIFIEKILDNSNILKKSVYINRIDSYFDLIRPQSVIFGRFYISSIFQDRGMVMDEVGRNGRKWHLAQQITYLVIKPHIMRLSMTTFHITRNIHMGGNFLLFITKYKIPPTIIIYNLLTNR